MEFDAFRMDGLGNDFVIIDQRKRSVSLTKDQIIKICDRNFLGCDQLIFIQNSTISNASMQFYNSDGSTSGACGNGTRCIANFISKETNNKTIILKTFSGLLKSEILGNKIVTTEVGKAKTEWSEIPLSEKLDTKNLNVKIFDKNNKEHIGGTAVNVGNPHIIFFVKDSSKVDIKKIGPKIENHRYFPQKINTTFAEVLDKKNIKVNVWERGAGKTKACGTAACAASVVASMKGLTDKNLQVHFEKGSLQINYKEDIFMTGPVSEVERIDIDI